jgi:hypothetical protein
MQHLHIDLGVIDGFEGMEGNGPVLGEPVDHRVAAAGTDYLAVDRVGTEIMGADFDNIRYLNYLWDQGVGEGNLSKIQVVGETIESCRRTYQMAPRFLQMPVRPLLNRTFLAMAMARGLDAAILDPLDQTLMASVCAAEALLGRDEMCLDYIRSFRAGRLEG